MKILKTTSECYSIIFHVNELESVVFYEHFGKTLYCAIPDTIGNIDHFTGS
ncbi:MAG: hypothetical protein ACFFD4_30135 [Candidatus Odinarchaeota archaeon]